MPLCAAPPSPGQKDLSAAVSLQEVFNELQENYKLILCRRFTRERVCLEALDDEDVPTTFITSSLPSRVHVGYFILIHLFWALQCPV